MGRENARRRRLQLRSQIKNLEGKLNYSETQLRDGFENMMKVCPAVEPFLFDYLDTHDVVSTTSMEGIPEIVDRVLAQTPAANDETRTRLLNIFTELTQPTVRRALKRALAMRRARFDAGLVKHAISTYLEHKDDPPPAGIYTGAINHLGPVRAVDRSTVSDLNAPTQASREDQRWALAQAKRLQGTRNPTELQRFSLEQYLRYRRAQGYSYLTIHEALAGLGVAAFRDWLFQQTEATAAEPLAKQDEDFNFQYAIVRALVADCDNGKMQYLLDQGLLIPEHLTQELYDDATRTFAAWDPPGTPYFLRHAATTGTVHTAFLEFCRSVRGFPVPAHPLEPGPYLMALGRLFTDEEMAPMVWLSNLVDEVMAAPRERMLEKAPNADDALRFLLDGICKDERMFYEGMYFGQYALQFSRQWARAGFPVLEAGHKVCASLCFTHGSQDPDPPWSAFEVKVPNGLVVVDGRELVRVYVWHEPKLARPWLIALDWKGPSDFITTGFRSENLVEPIRGVMGEGADDPINTEEYVNAIPVVMRLVAGLCMLVTAKEGIEEHVWRPKPPAHRHRPPGMEPPEGTRFVVSKNVQLDLRDQVREEIAGRPRRPGAKLTVQFVVRGHRRWQACGPKHAERRLIWIEPYWKGPMEARALLRGYDLKGEDPTA